MIVKTEELEPWLMLLEIPGVGPVCYRNLVDKFGSPSEVLRTPVPELASVQGMTGKAARAIAHAPRRIDVGKQVDQVKKHGASVINFWEEHYPENLREMTDPPPLLFIMGSPEAMAKESVAVVGSRFSSDYGRTMAEKISAELAERGFTIISGMARGIDSASHRGALAVGGRTVAVLGSGLDVVYPPENADLYGEICDSGAIVSEFPMGTPPDAPNFPRRNRIISGLSLGVVVVEAGERSGALLTAMCALDQGREVFAVPGNVTSSRSRGTNRLIKDGAKLVESAEDVLEELEGPLGRFVAHVSQPPPSIDISDEERVVFGALSTDPRHIDTIASGLGFPVQRTLSILLLLELKGVAKQLPAKMFVASHMQ